MEKHFDHFNIVDLFFHFAQKEPGKTCIIYKHRHISFGEFETEVSATAQYFLRKGIQKGDRVMVFIPMSIDLYRTVLALFRIGATAVFLDEWVSKKRMEVCCEVAQCKAIIGNYKVKVLSLVSRELRKIPIHLGLSWKGVEHQQHLPIPQTNQADTALITFTTGSTGTPKAAKRTHGFLKAQFDALINKIGSRPEEIDMPVLPIVLLMNLGSGATSVITDFKASKPNAMHPGKIVQLINQHQVTRIIASPFFVRQIATHLIDTKTGVPSVRNVFTGGAPVFPSEAALYVQAFPGIPIEVVYGSTEAEPISAIDATLLANEPVHLLTNGLNVGKVDASAVVKIISIIEGDINVSTSNALQHLEQPVGTIGEIIVAGNHVLREYLNNPQALMRNKIFIQDICWHRTGDSGYFNEEGYLFLTGRCNTLMHVQGTIIAPFIYESYLQNISGVALGTILLYNNVVSVFIEINAGGDKEYIKQCIREMPVAIGQVYFVKKMPRDQRHHSKIDYPQLLAMKSSRFSV